MDYQNALEEIKTEFPEFKVVEKKDSGFMKMIDRALKILSFGKADKFMTQFTTTIGFVVYVPEDWDSRDDDDKAEIMAHEAVHMRQANRYGMLLFSLMYLLLPFPVLFAYFRMRFEMEAYETSMQLAVARYGYDNVKRPEYREKLISQFTGPNYIFTWVYRPTIEKWFDNYLESLKPSK
jgi:hypothetical protein